MLPDKDKDIGNFSFKRAVDKKPLFLFGDPKRPTVKKIVIEKERMKPYLVNNCSLAHKKKTKNWARPENSLNKIRTYRDIFFKGPDFLTLLWRSGPIKRYLVFIVNAAISFTSGINYSLLALFMAIGNRS